jgi:predicted acetyltransferase
MAEFHAESTHVHGGGLFLLPEEEQWDLTAAGCARLVAVLREAAREGADPEQVPCEFSWIVDEAPDGSLEVVGVLALRLRLNQWLLENAGHVGYSVAPSHRRRGHATRALALAVRRATEVGIDRVLVTCDEDNAASAATIEAAGGVFEDVRNRQRRYWIGTPAPVSGR